MATRRLSRPRLTGRKAPRLAVLRSLLADIVQSSSDAIFSRKLDGTINTWNAAAERIFGYSAQEIIGRSSVALLPPDRPDEMRQLLDRVRRGERIRQFETVRRRKDGKPLTVSMSISPIWSAQGRIVGASTIARDISTEREMEARILETTERERQRLGRDLHDGLGQQLGGVELLCRTLAESLGKRKRPEARIAQLLVEQIQDALAQTRALARGLTPVMDSPNGLMLALEDFSATVRSLFHVRCIFRCEEPVLVHDHVASVHLFRIAQQAVTNAIRHGRAGRVEVGLSRQSGAVVLEVRDNGTGLPPGWQKSRGMGLRIMRYRASVLEGTIRWRLARPRGVIVTCKAPLLTKGQAP
jgi:two-component system, LuxR family, sensor kinase FixL